MPTVYHLLERAERIESVAASIYAALALRYSGDARARELFERLAAEEVQHASRIRLLAGRYRHDARLLARSPRVTGAELDGFVAEAQRALDEIREGRWPQDLAAVKRKLSELEDRLSKAHAEFLARDAHPELRAFFELLAQQDAAHARLLVES